MIVIGAVMAVTAVVMRILLDRMAVKYRGSSFFLARLGVLMILPVMLAACLGVFQAIHRVPPGDFAILLILGFTIAVVAALFTPFLVEFMGDFGVHMFMAIPDEDRLGDVKMFEKPRALARKGDHAGAVDAFREELGRTPDFAFAWRELADSLMKLQRADEAVDALERGAQAEKDPDQCVTTALRAVDLCFDRGNMTRAREILASLAARPWPPKLQAAIAAREGRLDA